ncbi:MAG: hypothetical protein Fur0021_36700 [Candidatus Promineifilaceae bacterium]
MPKIPTMGNWGRSAPKIDHKKGVSPAVDVVDIHHDKIQRKATRPGPQEKTIVPWRRGGKNYHDPQVHLEKL